MHRAGIDKRDYRIGEDKAMTAGGDVSFGFRWDGSKRQIK
jgi:hypothetical protein